MNKLIFSFLSLISIPVVSFCQKNLTVDANDVLTSNSKIVINTGNGQSFFTGHQIGSGYSYPGGGIFRAITDNPYGPTNYFFEGLTNGITNYSVRADGQGYFAGNMSIGTKDPIAKLTVFQSAELGGTARSSNLLSSISGNAGFGNPGNNFQNNIWIVRNQQGNDWFTARLHDGISIDGSYLSPQVNTRTWWERDPINNIQSWGDGLNTYLTINNGNVAIGTDNPKGYKLAVNGKIRAQEIKVEADGWPDYVFKPSYILPTLKDVKLYIDKNQHLPDMPSELEVAANGINLGEMNKLLTKKIEELTLYLIEQNKKLQLQEKINENLLDRVQQIEKKQNVN